MKEAAGEANLTVVAIVLIGIIALIATPLINNLVVTARARACCIDAGGTWDRQGDACMGGSAGMYNKCVGDEWDGPAHGG